MDLQHMYNIFPYLGEHDFPASIVRSGQSLSIRDILDRFAAGVPNEYPSSGHGEGSLSGDYDMIDRHSDQEEILSQVSQIRTAQEQAKKEKAKKAFDDLVDKKAKEKLEQQDDTSKQ